THKPQGGVPPQDNHPKAPSPREKENLSQRKNPNAPIPQDAMPPEDSQTQTPQSRSPTPDPIPSDKIPKDIGTLPIDRKGKRKADAPDIPVSMHKPPPRQPTPGPSTMRCPPVTVESESDMDVDEPDIPEPIPKRPQRMRQPLLRPGNIYGERSNPINI